MVRGGKGEEKERGWEGHVRREIEGGEREGKGRGAREERTRGRGERVGGRRKKF